MPIAAAKESSTNTLNAESSVDHAAFKPSKIKSDNIAKSNVMSKFGQHYLNSTSSTPVIAAPELNLANTKSVALWVSVHSSRRWESKYSRLAITLIYKDPDFRLALSGHSESAAKSESEGDEGRERALEICSCLY